MRFGKIGPGKVWCGSSGSVRLGGVWQGLARSAGVRQLGHGRTGSVSSGEVGSALFWQTRRGLVSKGGVG